MLHLLFNVYLGTVAIQGIDSALLRHFGWAGTALWHSPAFCSWQNSHWNSHLAGLSGREGHPPVSHTPCFSCLMLLFTQVMWYFGVSGWLTAVMKWRCSREKRSALHFRASLQVLIAMMERWIMTAEPEDQWLHLIVLGDLKSSFELQCTPKALQAVFPFSL